MAHYSQLPSAVQRLPWEEDISFGVLPPSCPRFPAPQRNPFRIEGAWPPDPAAPLLTIQGESANRPAQEIKVWLGTEDDPELRLTYGADTGIRIGRAQTTRRRITLPAARLESADVQLDVEAIRTLDRRGELRASSGVVLDDEQSHLSLQLGQTPIADPLFGVNAGLRASSIDFNSTGEVLLSRLAPALDPFIDHFGCSLGGITLSARIPQFAGKANFSAEQLSSFDLGLSIAPGALATIRAGAAAGTTSEGPAPLLRTIELAAGSETSAHFLIERTSKTQSPYGTLHIDTAASSLTAEVTDREGNRHHASAGFKTDIAGSLYAESAAPSHRILDRLSLVARDLVAQARKARNVFGDLPPGTGDTSVDVDWDVRLTNDTASEPVVNLTNDEQVRLALQADVKELAWRIGEQQRSRLMASTRVGVASQMHDGHLVVEGQASGPLEFSGAALPEERFELSLPFAVAFRDQLQRAPGSEAAWLWDQNYDDDFWRNYPAVYGQLLPQPVLNLNQFTAGPLSLRQLLFPLGALRLAVGHATNLQLHFPFEGRALFGDATGVLQTDIGWAEEQASVTAQGGLSLTDFQAGALGLASHGGHVPFVEDELSGRVTFRANHFLVDRNTISNALSGSSANQSFEGLDLDLRLSRSQRHPETPGVFQLTT